MPRVVSLYEANSEPLKSRLFPSNLINYLARRLLVHAVRLPVLLVHVFQSVFLQLIQQFLRVTFHLLSLRLRHFLLEHRNTDQSKISKRPPRVKSRTPNDRAAPKIEI